MLDLHCGRMYATEHALCDPSRILERRYSLAEIVERGVGVLVCLSVVPDFRPLWREHAPAAGERLHVPTLVAAGGAAVVVIAALALAATDPKAENVVLDMFAGV